MRNEAMQQHHMIPQLGADRGMVRQIELPTSSCSTGRMHSANPRKPSQLFSDVLWEQGGPRRRCRREAATVVALAVAMCTSLQAV